MESNVNILVASALDECQNYFSGILQKLGFRNITKVNSGVLLLNNMANNPDIIFLHNNLDNYNGIPLISKIHKKYPLVRVVFLSNPHEGITINESIHKDVFEHIIKGHDDFFKMKEVMDKYFDSRKYNHMVCAHGVSTCAHMRLIADAQEQIRKNISAELHDNISQLLGASKLYIETARISKTNQRELLKESNNIIESAINEIRKLSHSLSNHLTQSENFADLLHNLFSFLKHQKKFKFENNIYVNEIEPLLNKDQQHHFLRILQELVNNIVKYSEASCISLTTSVSKEYIEMVVSDNGKGFDQSENKDGIGLTNVIDRIKKMAGSYFLYTAPGKGCTWRIKIPIIISISM